MTEKNSDKATTEAVDATEDQAPDEATPEPTYGHIPPVAPDAAPQAPPPAGATYAEDGQAITTAEEHRKAVEREYSHWVATEDITIGGVAAFRTGDPVPRSHVDSGVVKKESVVGRDTKTANLIFDDLNRS